METEKFISIIRKVCIANHLDRYKRLLAEAPRVAGRDNDWQQHILPTWDSLNAKQREGVLRFVRLAMVETISDFFSVIENMGGSSEFKDDFALVYGPKRERIEDILDYFLAAEEDDVQASD